VNIKKSLHSIEYAAIGLSTVGTVAAVITQQVAYLAMPLTLSLSLSLIDRQQASRRSNQRLANLEQQFSRQIESLVKQSQTLQSELDALPPTVSKRNFDKLVASVNADRQQLQQLSTALIELEQRNKDLVPFLTEIDLTKDSLKQLSLNFSNFEQQFDRRQGAINGNYTDRSMDEIGSNGQKLITIDRSARLENLSLSFGESASDSLYLSIAQIKSKIQLLEESSQVAEDSIKKIGWRFLELERAFSERQDPIAIAEIDRSLLEIGSTIDLMSAELSSTKTDYLLKQSELSLDKDMLQAFMEKTNLEIQALAEKSHSTELLERVSDLDASLSDLHDYSLKLTNRIDLHTQHEIVEIINTAVSDLNISSLIQHEVDRSSQSQFEILKQVLPRTYLYELVCGREESRQILLDALAQSQERLILVCPWLTKFAVDSDVEALITAALSRGVAIDIGWGHLKDANNDRANLSKDKILKSCKRKSLYNAIPWIYQLQTEYPDILTLKVLGTHEKFLVCDRQFAMLGSHNYLTSGTSSSEREVGIKTDSPELIDKLIAIFDRAEA
jgi:PLD-like domain